MSSDTGTNSPGALSHCCDLFPEKFSFINYHCTFIICRSLRFSDFDLNPVPVLLFDTHFYLQPACAQKFEGNTEHSSLITKVFYVNQCCGTDHFFKTSARALVIFLLWLLGSKALNTRSRIWLRILYTKGKQYIIRGEIKSTFLEYCKKKE